MRIRLLQAWNGRRIGDELELDSGLCETLIRRHYAVEIKAIDAAPEDKSMALRGPGRPRKIQDKAV